MPPTGLIDGLISLYDFEELSGNTLDGFGNNHGTPAVINYDQPGKLSKCYRFIDVFDSQVSIPNAANLNFGQNQDFTFSLWFLNEYFDYRPNIIFKRKLTDGQEGYSLFYESRLIYNDSAGNERDNSYCFVIDTGPTFLLISTGKDSVMPNDPNWHHIVFYRRGTTMGIVLDNNAPKEYTHPDISASLVNTNELLLMYNPLGGQEAHGKGYLDQVAIWNKALTTEEIALLYNSGNGLPFANW